MYTFEDFLHKAITLKTDKLEKLASNHDVTSALAYMGDEQFGILIEFINTKFLKLIERLPQPPTDDEYCSLVSELICTKNGYYCLDLGVSFDHMSEFTAKVWTIESFKNILARTNQARNYFYHLYSENLARTKLKTRFDLLIGLTDEELEYLYQQKTNFKVSLSFEKNVDTMLSIRKASNAEQIASVKVPLILTGPGVTHADLRKINERKITKPTTGIDYTKLDTWTKSQKPDHSLTQTIQYLLRDTVQIMTQAGDTQTGKLRWHYENPSSGIVVLDQENGETGKNIEIEQIESINVIRKTPVFKKTPS